MCLNTFSKRTIKDTRIKAIDIVLAPLLLTYDSYFHTGYPRVDFLIDIIYVLVL